MYPFGRNDMPYQVFKVNRLRKVLRKLPTRLLETLDSEVEKIANNPLIGESKHGDLAGIRVHKFNYHGLQYLIAYLIDDVERAITVVAFGPHENFYRDLKRYLRR